MPVEIRVTEPENERPSTLRALAHLFNCLAADKMDAADRGTIGTLSYKVELDTKEAEAALQRLDALSGNEQPAVAGASSPSTPPPPPPAANAQADAQQSNGVELDINGLPWDGRIHASTKGKNQDGSWKALRGVDKTIVPGIEAELRAALASAGDVPPPPPPVVETQGQDTPPPPPPISGDAPPPPPPVVETAPAAPTGPTPADAFKLITALRKGGSVDRLPKENLDMALQTVGLSELAEFMAQAKDNPALAGEFVAALNTFALPEGA